MDADLLAGEAEVQREPRVALGREGAHLLGRHRLAKVAERALDDLDRLLLPERRDVLRRAAERLLGAVRGEDEAARERADGGQPLERLRDAVQVVDEERDPRGLGARAQHAEELVARLGEVQPGGGERRAEARGDVQQDVLERRRAPREVHARERPRVGAVPRLVVPLELDRELGEEGGRAAAVPPAQGERPEALLQAERLDLLDEVLPSDKVPHVVDDVRLAVRAELVQFVGARFVPVAPVITAVIADIIADIIPTVIAVRLGCAVLRATRQCLGIAALDVHGGVLPVQELRVVPGSLDDGAPQVVREPRLQVVQPLEQHPPAAPARRLRLLHAVEGGVVRHNVLGELRRRRVGEARPQCGDLCALRWRRRREEPEHVRGKRVERLVVTHVDKPAVSPTGTTSINTSTIICGEKSTTELQLGHAPSAELLRPREGRLVGGERVDVRRVSVAVSQEPDENLRLVDQPEAQRQRRRLLQHAPAQVDVEHAHTHPCGALAQHRHDLVDQHVALGLEVGKRRRDENPDGLPRQHSAQPAAHARRVGGGGRQEVQPAPVRQGDRPLLRRLLEALRRRDDEVLHERHVAVVRGDEAEHRLARACRRDDVAPRVVEREALLGAPARDVDEQQPRVDVPAVEAQRELDLLGVERAVGDQEERGTVGAPRDQLVDVVDEELVELAAAVPRALRRHAGDVAHQVRVRVHGVRARRQEDVRALARPRAEQRQEGGLLDRRRGVGEPPGGRLPAARLAGLAAAAEGEEHVAAPLDRQDVPARGELDGPRQRLPVAPEQRLRLLRRVREGALARLDVLLGVAAVRLRHLAAELVEALGDLVVGVQELERELPRARDRVLVLELPEHDVVVLGTHPGEDEVADVAEHRHERQLLVGEQRLPRPRNVALARHERLPRLGDRELHPLVGTLGVKLPGQPGAGERLEVPRVPPPEDGHDALCGLGDVQERDRLLQRDPQPLGVERRRALHLDDEPFLPSPLSRAGAASPAAAPRGAGGLAVLLLQGQHAVVQFLLCFGTLHLPRHGVVLGELVLVELRELERERLPQGGGHGAPLVLKVPEHLQPVFRQIDRREDVLDEERGTLLQPGGAREEVVAALPDVQVVARKNASLEKKLRVLLCNLLRKLSDPFVRHREEKRLLHFVEELPL